MSDSVGPRGRVYAVSSFFIDLTKLSKLYALHDNDIVLVQSPDDLLDARCTTIYCVGYVGRLLDLAVANRVVVGGCVRVVVDDL